MTEPLQQNHNQMGIDRRKLLIGAGAGAVGLAVAGAGLSAAPAFAGPSNASISRPDSVRRLFVLDRDPLFMNVGTVGSPPRQVLKAEEDELDLVAKQALSNYHATFDDIRGAVAPGFGCDLDEFVISANTTDGIGAILNGLALGPGDEVLTTNHEHPAVNTPLALLHNRRGVAIKRVAMPVGDQQRAEDYVSLFEAAIGPRTKVLLFSAPIFRTGTMLPIRMLAELAQRHGLISVVDGAHVPGLFAFKFRELGVDFLAGSAAKWQCAPARTGVLYIRNKVLAEFNPNPLPEFWLTVGSTQSYPDAGLPPRTSTRVQSYDIGALFQDIGNPSLAQFAGFQKACLLWDQLGRQAIQDYSIGLANRLKHEVSQRFGAASLYSAVSDARLLSAMTAFNPFVNPADVKDKTKADAFVAQLHDKFRITIRNTIVPVIGDPAVHYAMRVSTHLFHDNHDVDRFVDSAWRLSREMA